ncbi:MAG: hypothetical protein NTY36_01335 [Deltaproteobacteria bacterium]|nr:hypothetical protein [Deltaproteobacteria bacterium]
MMNKYLQSNTVRVGLLSVLAATTAYLSGQVDAAGALLLVITAVAQIIQRTLKLNKDGTPAPPEEFPGIDAGPGAGQ